MTEPNPTALPTPPGAGLSADVVRRHFQESAAVKQPAGAVLAAPAAEAAARMVAAFRGGLKVLGGGNGGSAAAAQHCAGERVGRLQRAGRAALPMLALTTDRPLRTCIANDFCYEDVFSRQVEAFAQPGDVLVATRPSAGRPATPRASRSAI